MSTNKKTIVCFGDSNTHGYYSMINGRYDETQRWTCLLQNLLGHDYCVKEEGLSGRTTCFDDPLFEGLSGFQLIYPVLMTHEPVDLLIIMLGTNDVKTRFHATPANIGRGMERLVRKAIDTRDAFRDQKPNILIITPPPIDQRYETTTVGGEMGPDCHQKTVALEPFFRNVAAQYGCHYLNAGEMEGVFMGPSDWMHLTMDGHRKLAEGLAQMIPGYFPKAATLKDQ